MDKELLQKLEVRLAALKAEQAEILKKKKIERNLETLQATRDTLNRLKATALKAYRNATIEAEELEFVQSNI